MEILENQLFFLLIRSFPRREILSKIGEQYPDTLSFFAWYAAPALIQHLGGRHRFCVNKRVPYYRQAS